VFNFLFDLVEHLSLALTVETL